MLGAVPVVVAAIAHLGTEQVEQLVMVGGDSRTGPAASLLVGVGVVRQPLHPVPLGAAVSSASTAIRSSSDAWKT